MSENVFSRWRIALIGPQSPPHGGMANQTRQLADLLIAEGAEVTRVIVNPAYWPRWIGVVPMLRALCRIFPYLTQLWRAAGHSDIFHIMANSGWSWHLFAVPAIWVAHFRGVAVVVNYRGGEAAKFLQTSAPLVRFSLSRVSALVVPSGFLKAVFKRFGITASIVPNIIDLRLFFPRSACRSGPPHLLVARNLERLYDIETALRAFLIVRDQFSLARLTVAGIGPDAHRLQQWVSDQGLCDVVNFTGALEREAMALLYRTSDIVINPSLADNQPNSLLEAWASGVPVVTTNVGGIPYLAQDGDTATLVKPSDPTSMAHACIALLYDDALWSVRSQAGMLAAQRYTWTCVKPVLLDVYQKSCFHSTNAKRR